MAAPFLDALIPECMELLSYAKSSRGPIIVAFSGGKDSIAMVLYLLEQGIDKARIHLHHHDVDGGGEPLFDWACTKDYCRAFACALGLKLYFSYRKGGITREIFRRNEGRQDIYYQCEPEGEFHCIRAKKKTPNTRMRFPAVSSNLLTRWCSSTVKIDVLASVVCRHPAYQRQVMVLTGERREESTARSKYAEWELYTANTKSRKAIHWRPILGWPEFAVWNILARWGIQPHPAYMLGWNRCSCQICIFGSSNKWATHLLLAKKKVDRVAAIEEQTQFTLYNGMTIYEKAAKGVAMEGLDPYWIEQATVRFTAPILVEKWMLPKGAFKKERAGA